MVNTSICLVQRLSSDDKLSSQNFRSFQQPPVLIWRAFQTPSFLARSVLVCSHLSASKRRTSPVPAAGATVFSQCQWIVSSSFVSMSFSISVQTVAYLERAEHGVKTNQYIGTVNVRSRYIIQFTTAWWHFWDRSLRYRRGFSGLSDTCLPLGEKYWGLCCFIRMTNEKAESTECQSCIYLRVVFSAFSRRMF